ncbi:MAG: hypothetical protein COA79_13165 [Planctomycetota bacterium]|nr:MAG: hypothetical protein COA79_13165 [Planctomycetota bacterium]
MQMDMEPSLYKDVGSLIRWQRQRVVQTLEEEFCLNHNDSTKRVNLFFTEGFLPVPYFYAHSPHVIARHLMMVTQFLDSNNDTVSVESKDGRMITYFCNVGADIPGILLKLYTENMDMDINGFDSIFTTAGYRIITFHKRLHELPYFDEEAKIQSRIILQMVKNTRNKNTELFIESLPKTYLIEEICSHRSSPRILRHLELFSLAIEKSGIHVFTSKVEEQGDTMGDVRISACVMNADDKVISSMLKVIQSFGINMVRSYYDQFHLPDNHGTIKILSVYLKEISNFDELIEAIKNIKFNTYHADELSEEGLEQEMGLCIRALSDKKRTLDDCMPIIIKLKELGMKNINIKEEGELGNFYLNVLSEFFKSCEYIGIGENWSLLRKLLNYENVEEFFVTASIDGRPVHKKGYRLRHSSVRGPAKGGLRLHPSAELSEVGALSFMMTWKCAKSKILFGGGKGGATMTPKEFGESIDYDMAISGFGKSLFLATGPFLDVPAGDVNCGAYEIGRISAGFKAAMRDLVSLVFASKFGAARVGKKLVHVKQARTTLEESFKIDPYDDAQLKLLMTSDHYLSLVLASHITGKPKMGVNVRNGATGRGVCYCTLAMIGQMYLEGIWEASEKLEESDITLLKKIAEVNETVLVKDSPDPLISNMEWDQLIYIVYPKLLRDKKVVLQGAGKVGISILQELEKFDVNVIAVADASGGVIGEKIKSEDLIDAVVNNGGVISLKKGVKKVLKGVVEGGGILIEECDILLPCALESAISFKNVKKLKAKIVVSGANGPVTPKAAEVLYEKGTRVVYDFLANSGGVTASYFEWLRGIVERFKFEAKEIHQRPFDISVMDSYVMPEFKTRINQILVSSESEKVDALWESVLRDIMFAGVNDDYNRAKKFKVRLKIAGFIDSILRVLSKLILSGNEEEAKLIWDSLPKDTKDQLKGYFEHPELNYGNFKKIAQELQ